jgi:hypothetical protein
LFDVARGDTGQARRVANLLLAWHNAQENGGWDPVDLSSVDAPIADDIITVIRLVRKSHSYPGELGFRKEIDAVWSPRRGRS